MQKSVFSLWRGTPSAWTTGYFQVVLQRTESYASLPRSTGAAVMSFPTAVQAQAEQTQVITAGRPPVEGLTIDDATTWDIDDALHLEVRADGVQLQVSIADVAEGIPLQSPLYEEAARRAETLYFADYNVPMLPPLLSEDRLSLLPDQPRPTLTFTLDLSPQGRVRGLHIAETVLCNRRRLTHPEVDTLLTDPGADPDAAMLRQLYSVAQDLFEQRTQHGALVFTDGEERWMATEEGLPAPLADAQHHKGHRIVQELMILTNKAAAAYMAQQDCPFLYRNHVPRQSAPERTAILEQMHLTRLNPYWAQAFAGRYPLWFHRATYGPVLEGHFGLNEAAYTHVTSPIRRLPDLINHYQLKAHVTGRALPFTQTDLAAMAALIHQQMDDNRTRYADEAVRVAPAPGPPPGKELLARMDREDFYQVLAHVCREGVLHGAMAEALQVRFAAQRLTPSHLYLLVFKGRFEGADGQAVRGEALTYIRDQVGLAKMVLNTHQQKEGLADLVVEIAGAGTRFWGRVVWEDALGLRSTAQYVLGSSKKEVDHAACCAFLQAYLEDRLVSAALTVPPAEPPSTPTVEVNGSNYVGQLNTYSQRQRWPRPRYQFAPARAAIPGGFVCTVFIAIADGIEEATATAANKQEAKQLAAMNGLAKLGVLAE